MYVDTNFISYVNRCSDDSRRVKPVTRTDRTGKHRDQQEPQASTTSRRAAHNHNGRLLEDEYESSSEEGFAGYGSNLSDQKGSQDQKPKHDPETPCNDKQTRLKQAYGVDGKSGPVNSFETAA